MILTTDNDLLDRSTEEASEKLTCQEPKLLTSQTLFNSVSDGVAKELE